MVLKKFLLLKFLSLYLKDFPQIIEKLLEGDVIEKSFYTLNKIGHLS